ncbi:hypothetical protein ASPWEDRAFT_367930 [Aspergillus wentii DTO 134E9]|uniref:Uncharacterized protein n=1 Tax=Aspergillus wentii DTO 134E9 TaxID=1073089 RepID=A0A1L9RWU2_ASPWE|nr:uncharacterized protein ASPWEDRAFT_367930 [Aspergillus wentii DTO 134E9]OJJ39308.1 hypothetical protein ASPWEDRAFT_367930 [Aspergillus wentii DTO 134E9]
MLGIIFFFFFFFTLCSLFFLHGFMALFLPCSFLLFFFLPCFFFSIYLIFLSNLSFLLSTLHISIFLYHLVSTLIGVMFMESD